MDALLASGGVAGCQRPPTPLILTSGRLPGQYAPREEAAYMSCTYTKISVMQRAVGSLLALSAVTEGPPGVCVRTDCSANRLKCFGVLLTLMGGGGFIFTSVIVLNWTV